MNMAGGLDCTVFPPGSSRLHNL